MQSLPPVGGEDGEIGETAHRVVRLAPEHDAICQHDGHAEITPIDEGQFITAAHNARFKHPQLKTGEPGVVDPLGQIGGVVIRVKDMAGDQESQRDGRVRCEILALAIALAPSDNALADDRVHRLRVLGGASSVMSSGSGRLTDHEPRVVLVDEHDREVGVEERLRAHQDGGMLHRAFSVFIFNDQGEVLLQRRSKDKPLFAGCWSNTCCSHPGPGDDIEAQARRRLTFEMGIDASLREVLTFTYQATDPASQLTEYEIDHVLIGTCNDDPTPHAEEVDDWRWVSIDSLLAEIAADGDSFSPWMPIALRRLIEEHAAP